MKKPIYFLSLAFLMLGYSNSGEAQVKKSTKLKIKTTVQTPKFEERNFGNPSGITDLKDILPTDNSYNSVKNLVESDKIIVSYDDNTFRSAEPLRRGDFIISFNSALEALNKMKINSGLDSNLINTFDRKRTGAVLNSVSQVKDLKEQSIYYPASKSLIETFGVAEPFLANKTLSASSIMTEKEVYDILHSTLGYTSTAFNPYSSSISRGKFAIALNNAVLQKAEQIADLHSQVMNKRDSERKVLQDILDQQEKMRKDSIIHENQRKAAVDAELAIKTKIKKKK